MRKANKPRHDNCTFCGQVFKNESVELQHVQQVKKRNTRLWRLTLTMIRSITLLCRNSIAQAVEWYRLHELAR